MSKWLVGIEGEQGVLESLPEKFILSNFKIIEDNGHYYLESQEFEKSNDSEIIRQIASKYIAVFNAINKLQNLTSDPISLNGIVVYEDDGGKRKYTVQTSLKIMWNVMGRDVLRPSNENDKSFPISSQWVSTALKNKKMQSVLALFHSSNLNWDNLYRILEIVKTEFGSGEGISRKQFKRFTQTNSSFAALGYKSRHPGKDYKKPKIPMKFEDARDLIRKLLSQWLDDKE